VSRLESYQIYRPLFCCLALDYRQSHPSIVVRSASLNKPSMDKPTFVVVGLEDRVERLLAILQIYQDDRIVYTSFDSGTWGRQLGRRSAVPINQIDFRSVEHVFIAFFDRNQDYSAVKSELQSLGCDSAKISTVFDPHPTLLAFERLFAINYKGNRTLAQEIIYHDCFERVNYAYGSILAVEQARRLNLPAVTLIETGVWTGRGLLNLCEWGHVLAYTFGVEVYVSGFDTGKGLPKCTDWRDHPELWQEGEMVTPDLNLLRSQLPSFCTLEIGDVAETVPLYFHKSNLKTRPIGFFSLDVDLYSSSVDALKLLEGADPEAMLPAVGMWIDDSYINVLQNSFCGEALAISEYNHRNHLRKIDIKKVRPNHPSMLWHYCFAFAHIFDHPVRQGRRPSALIGFNHSDY